MLIIVIIFTAITVFFSFVDLFSLVAENGGSCERSLSHLSSGRFKYSFSRFQPNLHNLVGRYLGLLYLVPISNISRGLRCSIFEYAR